jgi:hypothetical protein
MFLVYAAKEHDLSSYGVQTEDGTNGWIFDNYVEEVDIETGKLPNSVQHHLTTRRSNLHLECTGSYRPNSGRC